jgi:hypothetical protein
VLSTTKHAFVAQSHLFVDIVPDLPQPEPEPEPEPTELAAAAVTQLPKSKGAKPGTEPSHDETPIATGYCFLHGFGAHLTGQCNVISRQKIKLTPDQKALKRPVVKLGQPVPVDGQLPSVAVLPGYKMPK